MVRSFDASFDLCQRSLWRYCNDGFFSKPLKVDTAQLVCAVYIFLRSIHVYKMYFCTMLCKQHSGVLVRVIRSLDNTDYDISIVGYTWISTVGSGAENSRTKIPFPFINRHIADRCVSELRTHILWAMQSEWNMYGHAPVMERGFCGICSKLNRSINVTLVNCSAHCWKVPIIMCDEIVYQFTSNNGAAGLEWITNFITLYRDFITYPYWDSN